MSFWTRLLSGKLDRTSRPLAQANRFQPSLENLETRATPTATAVLSFGSEYMTSSQMDDGGWDINSRSFSSFRSLFHSSRSWMDVDGNGTVSSVDANLARDRVVEKVKEHFAPYDISIVVGDQDDYQHILTDSRPGDALVMITGNSDFIGSGAYGWGPEDGEGNPNDEIVWVMGREHLTFTNLDQFITQIAVTTSHELGHALGLRHIEDNSWNNTAYGNAIDHHMMFPGVGDSSRNSNFQDITYQVEGGSTQNAHQYLTQTLGASTKPWAAVLRPGYLTVQGSARKDVINVSPVWGSEDWRVSIRYETRYLIWNNMRFTVDPTNSPDVDSINPYSVPVYNITIRGDGGNDTLRVSESCTYSSVNHVSTRLFGDHGHDHLYGGGGIDYLYGGPGNDHLYGRDGLDFLYGGTNNDYLDGGHDNYEDRLKGEGGNDTFVQYRQSRHASSSWLSHLVFENEDRIRDFDSSRDEYEYRTLTNTSEPTFQTLDTSSISSSGLYLGSKSVFHVFGS